MMHRQNSYPPPPTPQPYAPSTPHQYNISPAQSHASYQSGYGNQYQSDDHRRHSGPPSQTYSSNPPSSRARGHYSNLSWTPATGSRGGIQLPPKTRGTPSLQDKKTEAQDDDDLFRPAKELQAEDVNLKETAEKKKEAAPKAATPPKEQAENKIKFALKAKAAAPSGIAPAVDMSIKREPLVDAKSTSTPQPTPFTQDKSEARGGEERRYDRDRERYREQDMRQYDSRYDGRGDGRYENGRYENDRYENDRYDDRYAERVDRRDDRNNGRWEDRRESRRSDRYDERRDDRRNDRRSDEERWDTRRPDTRHDFRKPQNPASAASNGVASQDISRSMGPGGVKAHEINRSARPSEVFKVVEQPVKIWKPRPTLNDEWMKSTSVYYRKPADGSLIGSGTYGTVFKSHHVYTKNLVALKKVKRGGDRDDGVS